MKIVKRREKRVEDMMLVLSEVQKRMRQGLEPALSLFCKELKMSPFAMELLPENLTEIEVTPQLALDVFHSIRKREKAQRILRKQRKVKKVERAFAFEDTSFLPERENLTANATPEPRPEDHYSPLELWRALVRLGFKGRITREEVFEYE